MFRVFALSVLLSLFVSPITAQTVSGDQDVDHNVDWKSAKWVAPKEIKPDAWILTFVRFTSTTSSFQYIEVYSSLSECESAKSSVTAAGTNWYTLCLPD